MSATAFGKYLCPKYTTAGIWRIGLVVFFHLSASAQVMHYSSVLEIRLTRSISIILLPIQLWSRLYRLFKDLASIQAGRIWSDLVEPIKLLWLGQEFKIKYLILHFLAFFIVFKILRHFHSTLLFYGHMYAYILLIYFTTTTYCNSLISIISPINKFLVHIITYRIWFTDVHNLIYLSIFTGGNFKFQ